MLKRSLFLIASLSLVLALVVSSCQKDDVIKSEEQTGAKSTQQSSLEFTNLDGSGNKNFTSVIEALTPKFELYSIFFMSRGATEYDPAVRGIDVRLSKLEPAITESNQYYVRVTNHYEKSNNVFETIHITDILIRDEEYDLSSGFSEIAYDKLFTDEGTGNGELRFSLIRTLNLMNIYFPVFFSIKYTKETKKIFDYAQFVPL